MFRLRGRLVDPSLNRVTAEGQTVQVEPKIMHVLVTLADRPGEVVTRDELMARVWPGVFVTDDVLHRAIRELRRLFDDDAEQPAVIETIRKRGYRLIAPIERIDRPPIPAFVVPPPPRPSLPAELRGPAARPWRGCRASRRSRRFSPRTLAGHRHAQVRHGPAGSVDTEARVRFTPFTSEPATMSPAALSASGRLAYVARGEVAVRTCSQSVAGCAGPADHPGRRS